MHKMDGVQRRRETDPLDLIEKQQPEICLPMESIFSEAVDGAAEVQNHTNDLLP